MMIQEIGKVSANVTVRPAVFLLELALPEIARLAQPGQFVHLLVPDASGVFLRRPFSIAGVEGDRVKFLIRIVGTGTRVLAQMKIGDSCDVIGPLGRGFRHKGFQTALLAGGGIGAAPLLFLREELIKRKKEVHFFLGARTQEEFPLSDKLVNRLSIIPTTDDGSFGRHGLVSDCLEEFLTQQKWQNAGVYSCGPTAMIKAVERICRQHDLPHQASLENRMACGIGVCQGCALRMKEGFKLVCKDGPVFEADEIDWSCFP